MNSTSNIRCDPNEFIGKRILVTGGTKGIGQAVVERLRHGGGTVIATARSVPPGANSEQFVQADVSTRTGADKVIRTTLDRLGGPDHLFNRVRGSLTPGGGPPAVAASNLHQGIAVQQLLP